MDVLKNHNHNVFDARWTGMPASASVVTLYRLSSFGGLYETVSDLCSQIFESVTGTVHLPTITTISELRAHTCGRINNIRFCEIDG